MSTIHSHLPPFSVAQNQQLGQSLLHLSARARPAASDPTGGGPESTATAGDPAAITRQIARQNLISILADPDAAAAANRSAIANLSAQPASALAAQSGQNAEDVRRLVSGD